MEHTNEVRLVFEAGHFQQRRADDGSFILADAPAEEGQGARLWLCVVLGDLEEELLDIELTWVVKVSL